MTNSKEWRDAKRSEDPDYFAKRDKEKRKTRREELLNDRSPNNPKNLKMKVWRANYIDRVIRSSGVSIFRISKKTGLSEGFLHKIKDRKHIRYEVGKRILDFLGIAEPESSKYFTYVPYAWSHHDLESPVVRSEWLASLVREYLSHNTSTCTGLAEKAFVGDKHIRRILNGEYRSTSLVIADRLWVGMGYYGPLPEEAWLLDANGDKVKTYSKKASAQAA